MGKMFTCRVCEKTDKDVEMFVGGIFGYAHMDCLLHADRVVDIYLEYIVTVENGTVFLANELIKAQKRVDSRHSTSTEIEG